MKKTVSILGSTGSIGISTLEIIDKKKNFFKINLLSANKNFKLICRQINKYKPNYFIINDSTIYKKTKKRFKKNKIKILNDFNKISLKKNEITISAIPGIAGLLPTLTMIKISKKILIANKESIICGWNLIKKQSEKNNTKIIPVDSEHFSIKKLIEHHKLEEIKKIYITASGGPFLNLKLTQIKKAKPKDALNHPKWKMGKKVTVDSASMMNKVLEFIEAQKLFNIPKKKLDILINPESLVHSIIELKNGLTKFIYHDTSMKIPLSNALFDDQIIIEEIFKNKKNKILKKLQNLTFLKPNKKQFPTLKLIARSNEYPSTPIIINAANEVLVNQFLDKKIPFLSIFKTIKTIMNHRNYKQYAIINPNNVDQIVKVDNWARLETQKILTKA